ncbi:unnamed protein product [Protopolystoma xenopodis]|uniref:Uncharacterized protein n=1 Tax=Protopolystoma xenopodis TaxID=117903 RepID=A0A448WLX2_9PLAT|nr:unnamed protein product [Protopolystoma xenopodis]
MPTSKQPAATNTTAVSSPSTASLTFNQSQSLVDSPPRGLSAASSILRISSSVACLVTGPLEQVGRLLRSRLSQFSSGSRSPAPTPPPSASSNLATRTLLKPSSRPPSSISITSSCSASAFSSLHAPNQSSAYLDRSSAALAPRRDNLPNLVWPGSCSHFAQGSSPISASTSPGCMMHRSHTSASTGPHQLEGNSAPSPASIFSSASPSHSSSRHNANRSSISSSFCLASENSPPASIGHLAGPTSHSVAGTTPASAAVAFAAALAATMAELSRPRVRRQRFYSLQTTLSAMFTGGGGYNIEANAEALGQSNCPSWQHGFRFSHQYTQQQTVRAPQLRLGTNQPPFFQVISRFKLDLFWHLKPI